MADQREEAKRQIVGEAGQDTVFDQALDQARGLEGTLAEHKHLQAMKDKELGSIGRLIGSGSSATMAMAALAFVVTMVLYVVLLIVIMWSDEKHASALAPYPDKILALSTLALGVVVGGKIKD